MQTKFTKLPDSTPKWVQFFHAGTEWLQTFEMLEAEMKKETGVILFWVYPHVLYFSLELFVKSLASHVDPTFDARKGGFGHSAAGIIDTYKTTIPIFKEISEDEDLFYLIKEYEKTLNTRFGETSVQIEGSDNQLVINSVYKLREEISKRTGL